MAKKRNKSAPAAQPMAAKSGSQKAIPTTAAAVPADVVGPAIAAPPEAPVSAVAAAAPAPSNPPAMQSAATAPAAPRERAVASLSDIRGVLIQLAGARLLLPNATIAEVLSYAPPEPVAEAPAWLLGKMRWRGWQLPLVAFAELAGFGKEPAGLGSKVVVLKALAGNAQAPYFAILSQGFPRLVTVSKSGLLPDSDAGDAALPLGVQARVLLNEDTAFVPDLQTVEALIGDALAQAA